VTEVGEEWAGVGNRIRLAREAAHMSVRELARKVDVSPSHVSNVERGLASFSVRALYSVVSALGISMDSLFEPVPVTAVEPSPPLTAIPTAPPEAPPPIPSPDPDPLADKGVLLRADARPTIPLPSGRRWERLTARAERGAEFIEVIYPPTDENEPPESFTTHDSREYGIVIEGALTVQVGFDVATLVKGDSIVFDSTIPHRFWNATSDEVRAVWFIQERPPFDDVASGSASTAGER
jgi:transcriptional regulator with XRE-family HTH domain